MLESEHFAFIVFSLISMTFLVKCYSLWYVNSMKEESVWFTAVVTQPQNNACLILCSQYICIYLMKKHDFLDMQSFILKYL